MKDAKGHGSEKRGGGDGGPASYQNVSTKPLLTNAAQARIAAHTDGVNKIGIDNPAYTTAQKVPGYNGKVTPLNALDYNTPGRMLRQRMSDMSKEDHKSAGDAHIAQAMAMNAAHGKLVDSAMGKLGMQSPGPLISGIVSDKFSEGDKNKLRDLAVGASKHTSAAFAHYAASGMRLPTARTRFEGLRGRS